MARRFLWIVAAITVLILLGLVVWRLAGDRMLRTMLTPSVDFAESVQTAPPDYTDSHNWVSRPGGRADDPALWTPEGYTAAPKPAAALFFVSPTAFIDRSRWNAPLDDKITNDRLDAFARTQASLFNGVAEIWIPRYRQATFGAFLQPGAEADAALDLAFGDVARAFDLFLAAQPIDRPLILAGHSQGSRHLLHLLAQRPDVLADRVVAIYAGGWPVMTPQDEKRLGLSLCKAPDESGCVLNWQTYAANGELDKAMASLSAAPDLSGQPLGRTGTMGCVNPLTGGPEPAAADANRGSLFGDRLEPHRVGARCNDQGLLLIDPAPADIGPYVMPGGNYHVYDYALFWANLRADAEARLSAFGAQRPAATLEAGEPN
ncbi:MAG: DUF3089 domain-containing protein [Sphingomonadaceae bacterium]